MICPELMVGILGENLKGRHHVRGLGVAWRILIKCVLNKSDLSVWSGVFRSGPIAGCSEQKVKLRFHRTHGLSALTDRLLILKSELVTLNTKSLRMKLHSISLPFCLYVM
jgi:hypothetical protein